MRKLSTVLAPIALIIGCATSATVTDDGGADDSSVADSGSCTPCDGGCVDLKTDTANCGKCGKACAMGASCVQGSCQCPNGQIACAGACVDPMADTNNCGKCGSVCGGGDAGPIMGGGKWGCKGGACGIVCPSSDAGATTECSGACVDTTTDINNCGTCGTACDPMAEACTQGMCCKKGQSVCPSDAGPACTDTASDANNCGTCGNTCSGMTPACANGKCVACGNDCWSNQGCLTQGGHCIRFACRAANAGGSFCNQCMGWSEVSYQDWMNNGWCKDVFAKYYSVNPNTAMCGSASSCCTTQKNCGTSDLAWHLFDGTNTYYTGPSLFQTPQTANCSNWNSIATGSYTRISVCKKY